MVAVARQRFVDGVIYNFIDQMVQPALAGRPDIHARAFSDRLQPLQNLDLGRVIFGLYRHIRFKLLYVLLGQVVVLHLMLVFSQCSSFLSREISRLSLCLLISWFYQDPKQTFRLLFFLILCRKPLSYDLFFKHFSSL